MTLLIRQLPLLALLLIVAVPAWGQEAKGVGVVTALTGQANLKRPQAPQAPLKLRDNLFVRDIVDTEKESRARVLLLGKSSVTVLELSRLEIREETRPDGTQRAIIDLATGKIRVMVARRLMKPGDEVQIRTPNAVAAVRGSDGVIEATTLPDGRPETLVLVASGVFEVSAPSTRPIAMAETWSDLPSGIRVVQAPALALGGGNPNVWIATGPPGLQQVVRRFASPSEINAAIQVFQIPGGVASGTQVGKREPNGEAVLATMEALTQVETLRAGGQPGTGRTLPSSTTPPTAGPTSTETSRGSTTQTSTSTPPPSTSTGEDAFSQLSPGNQRIAMALYNAQLSGESIPTLTLNEIAELKLTLGWGEIFKLLKSQELIMEGKKNLGQVVSEYVRSNVSFNRFLGNPVINVLDRVNGRTRGRGLGLGLGSSCAGGACSKGVVPPTP